jgi:hypothetical protein
LWRRYRGALEASRGALAALDEAASVLKGIGTVAPLALIGAAVALALFGNGTIDAGIAGGAAALAVSLRCSQAPGSSSPSSPAPDSTRALR